MEREGLLPWASEFAKGQLPRLLNEKQAARIMSVSVAALRRWRRERRGPSFLHLERCVRYDLREIELFLSQHSCDCKKAADCESVAERRLRLDHATVAG